MTALPSGLSRVRAAEGIAVPRRTPAHPHREGGKGKLREEYAAE